jgi:ferredoxin
MKKHTVRVQHQGSDYSFQVPEDQYILQTGERQGVVLPFSCRNGACTECAVKVLSGQLQQPEAMGLSQDLQQEGYALLCVSYARSDLVVETQNEDEVYELQFGRYFPREKPSFFGRVQSGLPLDED